MEEVGEEQEELAKKEKRTALLKDLGIMSIIVFIIAGIVIGITYLIIWLVTKEIPSFFEASLYSGTVLLGFGSISFCLRSVGRDATRDAHFWSGKKYDPTKNRLTVPTFGLLALIIGVILLSIGLIVIR
jgi:ABC-type phosphate transport system permease subunit